MRGPHGKVFSECPVCGAVAVHRGFAVAGFCSIRDARPPSAARAFSSCTNPPGGTPIFGCLGAVPAACIDAIANATASASATETEVNDLPPDTSVSLLNRYGNPVLARRAAAANTSTTWFWNSEWCVDQTDVGPELRRSLAASRAVLNH